MQGKGEYSKRKLRNLWLKEFRVIMMIKGV